MYGERLGDGVEYHLMKPTPRRLVPFTTGRRFHEISWKWVDPSPPPLRVINSHMSCICLSHVDHMLITWVSHHMSFICLFIYVSHVSFICLSYVYHMSITSLVFHMSIYIHISHVFHMSIICVSHLSHMSITCHVRCNLAHSCTRAATRNLKSL